MDKDCISDKSKRLSHSEGASSELEQGAIYVDAKNLKDCITVMWSIFQKASSTGTALSRTAGSSISSRKSPVRMPKQNVGMI